MLLYKGPLHGGPLEFMQGIFAEEKMCEIFKKSGLTNPSGAWYYENPPRKNGGNGV